MAVLLKYRGLKETKRNVKRTGTAVKRGLLEAIEEAARIIERELKKNKLRGGNPLHVRSGRLVKSVHTKIVKSRFAAFVGTPTEYARILENGGTIVPRNAKVLTIPLRAAKTKAGKGRGGPREVGEDYDATYWSRIDARKLVLFGVRDGRVTPLFLGVRKVTIPEFKPFALAQKKHEPRVKALTQKRLTRHIEDANA